jgi:hypothetical protein
MADAHDFLVLDSAGAPLTGAAGGMSAIARDVTGATRTAPSITEPTPGTYRVTPTDADETAGTVVVVDTGVGNSPRRVAIACFKADNSNQFFAVAVENPDSTAWTGAAPTVGSYASSSGARTPPTLVAVEAAYVFVAVPTAADVTADTAIRIDGPAGSAQPYWYGSTIPTVVSSSSPWDAPSPGPLKDAAFDVATFLDTKTAGGVLLTKGTNLFIGQMRSTDRTPAPAVFCLGTGGPQNEPYFGADRSALFRPTVQVVVRGPAGDDQTGALIAREVLAWLNQRLVTGYVSWFTRDSAPAYLGPDSSNHGQWAINVECVYRASLG